MLIKQIKAITAASNTIDEINAFLRTLPAERVVSVTFNYFPYPNNPDMHRPVGLIIYLEDLCEKNR